MYNLYTFFIAHFDCSHTRTHYSEFFWERWLHAISKCNDFIDIQHTTHIVITHIASTFLALALHSLTPCCCLNYPLLLFKLSLALVLIFPCSRFNFPLLSF